MKTLTKISLLFLFCITRTACTAVVGNKLDSLDGGPDTPMTACTGAADGTECDDGNFCNGIDACLSGVCVSLGNPADDGQTCLGGDTTQICVEGRCTASRCGDGIVSTENGEQCETRADSTIGCTAQCQYICEHDNACNTDDSPCDNNLECKESHRCGVIVGADNPEGNTCTTADDEAGTCQANECRP